MAERTTEPGRLVSDERYELLAGDETERTKLYTVRFYLHFTVDEWRKLPWWQQRLYIEGLNKHHPWNPEGQVEEEPYPQGDEEDISGFAALGIKVQRA